MIGRVSVCIIILVASCLSYSFAQSQKADIEVKKLTATQLEDLVKSRRGRSLIVNVWATWCVPCVEEFPELIELDKTYAPKGLDLVVITLDDPEEVTTKVLPFLRRMNARMPAFINAFEPSTALIDALHPKWSGAIPATFVYDRNGTFLEMAIGRQSKEKFESMATRSLAPLR